jgi:O-antigen/teichoic acid export membrane protein
MPELKVYLEKIQAHPHYARAVYWGKAISVTGSVQVLVQAAGLICGIWIIRLLPTKEYAFYTLANTMLGMMTTLADSGISNGVMVLGGRVWQDRKKLGVVLATGLDLRRKFAWGSLNVSVPVLAYLLMHQGAGWMETLFIILVLIPAFWAALSDSLLEIIPKLHQDIKPLQKNQLAVSTGRLLLSGLGLVLFPWTAAALLANGLPRLYGNSKLRIIARKFSDSGLPPDKEVRSDILKMVKKIMPLVIYYSFSGQITIWILSLFGSRESIAQIGALGRFSLLLNFFTILVTTLLLPRFARLPNDHRRLILKTFARIELLIIGFCLVILLLVILFSDQLLWILGKSYASLSKELLLIMVSNCTGLLSATTGNMITSRGHIMNPFIIILSNISCLILAVFFWNLSSLQGILYYNIFMTLVSYCLIIFYSIWLIKQNKM